MPNNSDINTRVSTNEGRMKAAELDIRHIEDNIDRVENHLIEMGQKKAIPPSTIITAVLGFLSIFGTAIFGILNYVDGQMQYMHDANHRYEVRINDLEEDLKGLSSSFHDHRGRTEERVRSLEKDLHSVRRDHIAANLHREPSADGDGY